MSEAAESVAGYVDPLTKDEKLRQRVAAALAAGAAARRQTRKHVGLRALAVQLGSDPVLRAQLTEVAEQLKGARRRADKARSHKLRNTLLFVGGVGMVVAAVPSLRNAVLSKLGHDDGWPSGEPMTTPESAPTTTDGGGSEVEAS
ncbi:MAG: hypothetical protein ACXVRJ_13280 [Gaiellaceae bacterium]